MPRDPFQNARAGYDPSFPSSGDGFTLANFKNAFQALAFMDFLIGQPRAHTPADMKIMIRGRDASGYFRNVYWGNADQRTVLQSGDSPLMSAPAANPRYDIIYATPSGDYRIATGSEAATPNLPALSPSGDTRLPICAVFHKVGETKIVNFEDKDSNSGDGYIAHDLRPFIRYAKGL